MQKRWLKDFEFYINTTTWSTAQDMVQAGRVKNLREIERHFWVALVEDGEGIYETEMMITPQKIKAYTCECFTEGRRLMCSHVAASLLKLRQFLEQRAEEKQRQEEAKTPAELNRLTVQAVLDNAGPDDLTAFVRHYARRDRDFALALKTWFAGAVTDAENPYTLVLDAALPRQARTQLREPDFRRLRKTLGELDQQLDSARHQQNFRTVFQIGQALLLKLPPLLLAAENGRRETLVAYCTIAFQAMEDTWRKSPSPELREQIQNIFMDVCARDVVPKEMHREVIRLMGEIAVRDDVFEQLNTLYDQKAHPVPSLLLHWFLSALALRKLPEAVVRVLEDYTADSGVIREAILQLYYLNHWEAAQMAGEHFLPRCAFNSAHKREIEDLLLFIAEKNGDELRQTALLRERFVQNGQFEVFNRLKQAAQQRWPEVLRQLKTELAKRNDRRILAAVLAAENRLEELAELLQNVHETVIFQRYEDLFLPEHKTFVINWYSAAMTEYLREHLGRQASAHVRSALAGLVQKGEKALVLEVIHALVSRFEERHTLAEELAELFPKKKEMRR